MDLIVVGTSEALTMVEAGADEVPEETILEAFELAHAEIRRICEALEDLREQVGKPKWVDTELTVELEAEHGEAVGAAIAGHGLREAPWSSTSSSRAPHRRSRWPRPRTTWFAGLR